MDRFLEKLSGALYGGAIGDAMGGPVEMCSPSEIARLFPDWDFHQFLPTRSGPDALLRKGSGHITDDTLMVEALVRAYLASEAHLDAYGYEHYLLPEVCDRDVWIPERQASLPLIDRPLWIPERYPSQRLRSHHVDPRSAGVGNIVNCGLAMYLLPVGAVNAGDPEAAYQEATALGGAHNESFAVEAGAVMAAVAATALGAEATVDDVLETAVRVSRDGTHRAITAVLAATDPHDAEEVCITRAREAVVPFLQQEQHVADDAPHAAGMAISDSGRPSRLKSIEELPAALAAVRYGEGDFLTTLRAAVHYGQDCDSIAGMAGGLCGALVGVEAVPAVLREALDIANDRDFHGLAVDFAAVIRRIHAQDAVRWARHAEALDTWKASDERA